MLNTYARVCVDESDEEEAAASRLIREAAGSLSVPAVPTTVVTSTGAVRGRTQQRVQHRRGGGSGSQCAEAASRTVASTSFSSRAAGPSIGNLIDLGDDTEPRPRPTSTTQGRHRGRQHGPSQSAVELVTLAQHVDPFFDFTGVPSTSTAQRQQQQQLGAAAATSDGRQPQHPLDFLFGEAPADPGREDSHSATSTSGGASGARQGAFHSFGSFSDLLRGFGAGPTANQATSASGIQVPGSGEPGPAVSSGAAITLWGSSAASPAGPAPGAPAAAWSAVSPSLARNLHSQSSNGIDDLLLQHRAMREALDGVLDGAGVPGGRGGPRASSASPPGLHYQAPGVMRTDRDGAEDFFDPFGNATPSASGSNPTAAAASMSAAPRGRSASSSADGTTTARNFDADAEGGRDGSFVVGSGGGEGYSMSQRELLLYAIPLFKDKLVFLPVVNWKDADDTSTVLGKVSAGVSNVQQNISNMWHSLKDKGNFSAKIYKAGQAILENLNAEERLMKNIPRKANKLVVHHPATVPPDEVQDQLTQLTASFCFKSVGKAAVAGVMLPVAVGLEVIAVPGIGWYTAYQLFKSTSAAAGGSRLNNYLKSDKSEVRVCYAPSTKMDMYIIKSRISPDGVLGTEEIEDLCHDIREPSLLHPLMELRNRHLRKTQTTKADYALLPMSAPDVDEQYGSGPKKDN